MAKVVTGPDEAVPQLTRAGFSTSKGLWRIDEHLASMSKRTEARHSTIMVRWPGSGLNAVSATHLGFYRASQLCISVDAVRLRSIS